MSSPHRSWTTPIVLTGILGLAVVTGIARTWDPPDAAPNAGRKHPEPAATAASELPDPTAPTRTAAVATEPTAATAGPSLQVRLQGLHPKAPWTAPLHLDVDGPVDGQWLEHDGWATPDAAGRCTLPLPAWFATASVKGRIGAADVNYLALQHRWEGAIDAAQELVLDVQVTGVIEGHVTDTRGNPVPAARVCAFAIRDGVAVDSKLAECSANADGHYRLGAPPDVPLLLIASPMQEGQGSRNDALPRGSVIDTGEMRSDLLPVTRRASCTVAEARTEDFVLPDAVPITGVVQWSNGKPVPRAAVRAMMPAERTFQISSASSIHVLSNGLAAPSTQTHTDGQGQFQLPGVPGAPVDVKVVRLGWNVILLDDWPTQTSVPPQRVDLTVALPITLRVLHAGVVVPLAGIELGRMTTSAGANGELALVTTRSLRVRATHKHLQSPWLTLAPEAAGTTIELELTAALVEISIEFEGDFRVRNATIAWRSDDGREGREHLLRDDRSGPFQLFLPPGRYHLRAGPGGGERNGLFLLPIERDVVVDAVPQRLTLPAGFGGRFTVHATDPSGLYIGGTCRVVDASGTDVTGRFLVNAEGGGNLGKPGELLPGGPNDFTVLLPPGDYLLTFDFGDYGAREQRVTVRARETADVRVRL